MRFTSHPSWLVLATAILFMVSACREDESVVRPPADGRQGWFLDRLKALADSADLSDASKVGAILQTRFQKTVDTTRASRTEAFAKSFERDEYIPVGKSWFIAGPLGYASIANFKSDGHNSGYSAGVDPTAHGDTVNFKYFESKRFGLPERDSLVIYDRARDDSETSVIFYGIQKMACLTLADVRAKFPGLVHMASTDASAERYTYHAAPQEDAGIVLTFAAPDGQCIPVVEIAQFSAFGNRHARARYKFLGCVEDVAKTFCRQHGDRSGQLPLYDELNSAMRERCGTFEPYLEKEPRTNQRPPADRERDDLPTSCPYPRPTNY